MLETSPGYNDIPSWLPQSLHGAYRTLSDPLVQMSPMAGVSSALPVGLRVMRTSGTAPQRQMLEQVVSFLDQKVPRLTDMIRNNFDARINVGSPRLDAQGWSKFPAGKAIVTSSPMIPKNPPFLNVKIHPNELVPGNTPEIASTMVHEFLHPKVGGIRSELLRKMLPKAQESLSKIPEAMPHPEWYKPGREMMEELVVRMMEQNISRKKLGF